MLKQLVDDEDEDDDDDDDAYNDSFMRLANCAGRQLAIGRYDFGLFLNFITGKQGLLCVTETWRYGNIRDYGDHVETPHGTTIGCEKSSNG